MSMDITQTGIIGHGISPNGTPMTLARYELGKEPKGIVYWLTRPYEERWAAAEQLRRMVYGHDRTQSRLERILRVSER
jgi:hypothetical protein